MGYIFVEQARVLAMSTAREIPGEYGSSYQDMPMAFEVAVATEDEDFYTITLSLTNGQILDNRGYVCQWPRHFWRVRNTALNPGAKYRLSRKRRSEYVEVLQRRAKLSVPYKYRALEPDGNNQCAKGRNQRQASS